MAATWTGAVSNGCNNDDDWRPAAVPHAGKKTVVPATPSRGRQVYGNISNDGLITLTSSREQTNFIVIGQVTPSGAGALTATNRIYSGASGSPLDNQEPIKSAGKIFNYAASPAQIFNPTGAI